MEIRLWSKVAYTVYTVYDIENCREKVNTVPVSYDIENCEEWKITV